MIAGTRIVRAKACSKRHATCLPADHGACRFNLATAGAGPAVAKSRFSTKSTDRRGLEGTHCRQGSTALVKSTWEMIHMRIAVDLPPLPVGRLCRAPRVLPPGRLPSDKRLGPLKDLNGYFPFVPCKSEAEWAVRAERIRRQLLVATGLWPMPAPTPPRAVVHGRVDRDGYTVEKVFLESFPGHFVTGNLYRPKGRSGRLPAVLSPHGHWANGRFYDAGEKRTPQVDRPRGRALRSQRPLSAPGPLRAACPHGLHRLPLRHGGLRRQRAACPPCGRPRRR